MKTFIIVNNKTNEEAETANDIQVKDIYGIYQNKNKSFWECKVANLKLIEDSNFKSNEILKTFVIKEIDLDTDAIITTYYLENRNTIINSKTNKKYKIPVFYISKKLNELNKFI